jgi:CDP-diacylglycerol--serine O-phosphatidyltransferase
MLGPKHRPDTLPFLLLLPNLITIVGLCAGLTSIRFTLIERFDAAAALIILAAAIDGLDGLMARRLNAASRFGAELDSLSDFVTFGVAPGLLVFEFALADVRGVGWVFVLVYVICACLRLARFNVNRDAPVPAGRAHFVGVPAPAGAMLGLLPVFLTLAGVADAAAIPVLIAPYLGLVGLLMVSRLRTYSPKGLRVPRDKSRWVLIGAAFLVGVAFTRFWLLMVLADLAYGAALVHAGWMARTKRREARGD